MIPSSWRTWLASTLNNSPCEHFEAVTNNMALVALGQSERIIAANSTPYTQRRWRDEEVSNAK